MFLFYFDIEKKKKHQCLNFPQATSYNYILHHQTQ